MRGDRAGAERVRAEASALAQQVMKLYADRRGFSHARFPDGSLRIMCSSGNDRIRGRAMINETRSVKSYRRAPGSGPRGLCSMGAAESEHSPDVERQSR